MHSCVIVSLPALVLVYCKHPYANHYVPLALRAVTQSQHVALGRRETFCPSVYSHAGVFVNARRLISFEACTPTRTILFRLAHKCSYFPPHSIIMRCFWRRCRNKGGIIWMRVIWYMVHASCLPCIEHLTHLPPGLPVPRFVFGHCQGVAVLSWWEIVSWQADQACWRAWQRGDAFFNQGCIEMRACVSLMNKKKEGDRKTNKETGRGVERWVWQIPLWGSLGMMLVDLARWWPVIDQHRAQVPRGTFTHQSWVNEGETAPGCMSTQSQDGERTLGAFVYLFPPICCILYNATVSQLNEAWGECSINSLRIGGHFCLRSSLLRCPAQKVVFWKVLDGNKAF